MGVVRVDVAPELLRWAVRRAGWDEETALRRVPKLADWLAGASRPTLKQLEKFASDTHAPFGMLFLPDPPGRDHSDSGHAHDPRRRGGRAIR